MKKFLVLTLFLGGCSNPNTYSSSKPAVTDTLTLSSATTGLTGSGIFYDYTRATTVGFSFTSLPYSGSFSDYAHDYIGFAVTFSASTTFTYQLDTLSNTVFANPSFNSGQ